MNFSTTNFQNLITTSEPDDVEIEKRAPYWYIIIEVSYLCAFALSTILIRKLNFMKTDDDAVTAHHRYHAIRIKKQEDDLIEAQRKQENFIMASKENV